MDAGDVTFVRRGGWRNCSSVRPCWLVIGVHRCWFSRNRNYSQEQIVLRWKKVVVVGVTCFAIGCQTWWEFGCFGSNVKNSCWSVLFTTKQKDSGWAPWWVRADLYTGYKQDRACRDQWCLSADLLSAEARLSSPRDQESEQLPLKLL